MRGLVGKRANAIRGPRVPEKVVQAHVTALLRSIGAEVWTLGTRRPRGESQSTRQSPGIPDLFAILPPQPFPAPISVVKGFEMAPVGVPLWVEVKAADGRLSPEQLGFRDSCKAAALAHVVGGVDEVIAFVVAGGWLKADNVPHYRRTGIGVRQA